MLGGVPFPMACFTFGGMAVAGAPAQSSFTSGATGAGRTALPAGIGGAGGLAAATFAASAFTAGGTFARGVKAVGLPPLAAAAFTLAAAAA